ncbi:MAG TPA: 1-(5-phosphoribosyl)-5-[(5-phosphoribosylamino)methylideneamino] imidazole-4-carboxamide isomerase [Syntrophorhabdaceae bacterium]|nr:1-(5-phosphoribosyl)-5-[(5-phosphoribosylamino)methylideneamino] imidazole-4-carboxamide isomerase [Syntrophorhabdaceae bacterium]HPU30330.1 1-(5-phosphoribosyl)-5-[(5-phosphoribosylamino)methylideneamino] imidazole-4-carboxamide isomerase [Syntrophorhabdaceae bacterium]
MKLLFAMDLINNKAVRLKRGNFSDVTVYSESPVEKIKEMISQGARDFHIVDLDGAKEGVPVHYELVKNIREQIKGYMEVGGGIRSYNTIEMYNDLGVDGIIIGTRALEDEDFFKGLSRYKNIVLGLDVYEGKPMIKGWSQPVNRTVEDIIRQSEEVGIKALLCTAIARDGMLVGPDFEGLERVLNITEIPVIASGGVTTIEDVKRLKSMGVWATIIGKAFYEGLIRIEDAMELVD